MSTPEPLAVDAVGAADLVGVARSTWLKLHSQGRTPRCFRMGRRVLWSVDELRAWVRAGAPPREKWETSGARR